MQIAVSSFNRNIFAKNSFWSNRQKRAARLIEVVLIAGGLLAAVVWLGGQS